MGARLALRTVTGLNTTRLSKPVTLPSTGPGATWVILDDQPLALAPGLAPLITRNTIWIDSDTGITARDADLAIGILRNGSLVSDLDSPPDLRLPTNDIAWGSGAASEQEKLHDETEEPPYHDDWIHLQEQQNLQYLLD